MDWGAILPSTVGSLITVFLVWLASRLWGWARNRKETLLQYLKKIGASLFVVISVAGAALISSLLLSALASYDPIMWYDIMMTLARFAQTIPALFLAVAVVGILFDQPRGKDLFQLIAMMFGALLMLSFLRVSDEHLEREKDKLLQTLEVGGQATIADPFSQANLDRITDAINEKDQQHFVQELKSLYPRLREYGLLTPAIEPVRTGKSEYDGTWYGYHVTFLKALRRQVRDGTFDLDQWNIDVQRENRKRKDFLGQTK